MGLWPLRPSLSGWAAQLGCGHLVTQRSEIEFEARARQCICPWLNIRLQEGAASFPALHLALAWLAKQLRQARPALLVALLWQPCQHLCSSPRMLEMRFIGISSAWARRPASEYLQDKPGSIFAQIQAMQQIQAQKTTKTVRLVS